MFLFRYLLISVYSKFLEREASWLPTWPE